LREVPVPEAFLLISDSSKCLPNAIYMSIDLIVAGRDERRQERSFNPRRRGPRWNRSEGKE
jgi:hypothetical protein